MFLLSPEKGLQDSVLKYTVAVFAAFLAFVPAFILDYYGQTFFPFLIAYLAVVGSAWYGGIRGGATTSLFFIFLMGVYTIFVQPGLVTGAPFFYLLVSVSFVIQGILISLVIHKVRQFDELTRYKKKVRQQASILVVQRRAIEKAREEVKARDEFLSIASHELKTPLTSMILQIQTMLNSIRNVSLANFSVQKFLDKLESAEQQSIKLTKMINDLLNVSLITTGRIDLELEKFDLSVLVKDTVDRFSEKLTEKNYTVKMFLKDPVVGNWDKVRIEQVVTNLFSNAMKYGEGRPIQVKVTNSGGHARLSVTDEGIGISRDMQDKIFARFARGVSSADYRGLGVGLFITSQIVKAHGGKVKVDSSLGNGSTFLVELPLKPSSPSSTPKPSA